MARLNENRPGVWVAITTAVVLLSLAIAIPSIALPPQARVSIAALLSALGAAISAYVIAYKVWDIPLLCPRGRTIDCKKVLDSGFSIWLGLPSAIFGLAFFVALALLLHYGEYLASAGLCAVGLLSTAERIGAQNRIGRICIYCNAAHVAVVSISMILLSLAA